MTGTISSPNATHSGYVRLLVRRLDDDTVEYLVGDSSRRADGWATLPADLQDRVQWDAPGVT